MELYEPSAGEAFDLLTRGTIKEVVGDEKSASLSAWNLLGKRWTFLILTKLFASAQSFQELANHIEGISEKVLAERLKELEREGVLQRKNSSGRHYRAMYHLTAKGEALEPVIRALCIWSQCL